MLAKLGKEGSFFRTLEVYGAHSLISENSMVETLYQFAFSTERRDVENKTKQRQHGFSPLRIQFFIESKKRLMEFNFF